MAHVLLRLWKISEFLGSWLVIAKSLLIGVRTVSNQLNGIDATKIGYNRRTYNQQPIIGPKCNENRLQSAYIQPATK